MFILFYFFIMFQFLLKLELNENSAYIISKCLLLILLWIINAYIITYAGLLQLFRPHKIQLQADLSLSNQKPSPTACSISIICFAGMYVIIWKRKICNYFIATLMKITLITGVNLRWLTASVMRFPVVLYSCLIYDTLCAQSIHLISCE